MQTWMRPRTVPRPGAHFISVSLLRVHRCTPFEVCFDLFALQPEFAELFFRQEVQLIAVVRGTGLARVAIAHQAIGLDRGRKLNHRHPCLSMCRRADAILVWFRPGDHAECAQIAIAATARHIDTVKDEARDIAIDRVDLAVGLLCLRDCLPQLLDGGLRIFQTRRRVDRVIRAPRNGKAIEAGHARPGEQLGPFLEQDTAAIVS